jgi:hypothetical protein
LVCARRTRCGRFSLFPIHRIATYCSHRLRCGIWRVPGPVPPKRRRPTTSRESDAWMTRPARAVSGRPGLSTPRDRSPARPERGERGRGETGERSVSRVRLGRNRVSPLVQPDRQQGPHRRSTGTRIHAAGQSGPLAVVPGLCLALSLEGFARDVPAFNSANQRPEASFPDAHAASRPSQSITSARR